MQDVTPLAERGEVPRTVVGRIVIEMGGRQNHARRRGRCRAAWSLEVRPYLIVFSVSIRFRRSLYPMKARTQRANRSNVPIGSQYSTPSKAFPLSPQSD